MKKQIERFRRWLIRKLGGFVIYPEERPRVIIESVKVVPQEIKVVAKFSQFEMYDVTPQDIERAAKEKLHKAILNKLIECGYIDICTSQNDIYQELSVKARIWVVDPKVMRKALNK